VDHDWPALPAVAVVRVCPRVAAGRNTAQEERRSSSRASQRRSWSDGHREHRWLELMAVGPISRAARPVPTDAVSGERMRSMWH